VLLLSQPLPESIPLPAPAQSFFRWVFMIASQNPNVDTLKPVYYMLKGACRHLYGFLAREEQEQFNKDLSRVLSSKGAEQMTLWLWCFGIILLVEHPDEIGQLQSARPDVEQSISTTTPGTRWKTPSGCKLFGSVNHVYKTINMTYLGVIYATKGDVGVSDLDALEAIRIAARTLQFVDRAAIDGWLKSGDQAQNIFSKLPSKISRTDINPAVQLEALRFYAMVAGERGLPAEVVMQYEQRIMNIASLVETNSLSESLAISLPLFSVSN
jgi:hypothetical protein